MIKKLVSIVKKTWKWWLLLTILVLLIDVSPLIDTKPTLEGTQANIARSKAKMLADGLAATDDRVSLDLDGNDIDAISATLSHMFENTEFGLNYSPTMVQGASSTFLDLGLFNIYFNVYCEISLYYNRSELNLCKVGDLYIPGMLVESFIYGGLSLVFDKEVADTIDNLISSVSVIDQKLYVNADKSVDFKERVNDTLNDASSFAKMAIQTGIPDPAIIQVYLDDMLSYPKTDDMSVYIKRSMQLASLRSIDNNPIIENKAALWAWAISFGTSRFAMLAGIKDYPVNQQVMLRGRRDLAQHFIYSAIIAELSSSQFSSNAGELKEILDSGKGGSGFSFADLLADNTGVAFAETITENDRRARQAQDLLASMTEKDTFFPYIHDLPEGLSERSFKIIFSDSSSDSYLNFVDQVNTRIDELILYKTPDRLSQKIFLDIPKARLQIQDQAKGKWLNIDTHIHTQYSDGAHTIKEIAEKARFFGCDAIAITDHGDRNLPGVLSDAYFDDIRKANIDNRGLTVLPGLEWNLPPFNGREHATVLLPDDPDLKLKLRQFRSSFDHYREFTLRHITIEPALKWINELDQRSLVSPVIIYNHPSRKDNHPSENKYDISKWQSLSASVIGMSGSPGHQKKRGINNGSYETKLITKHGLDPVMPAGSEWDRLLQKGFRVLAARAPSDFHNLSMDYWPCEFSSTHVFSRSNSHNDILQALINGRTWAQHGRFVERLNFMVLAKNNAIFSGQSVTNDGLKDLRVNVDITLANKDWQGFSTRLDELYLVVVTDTRIIEMELLSDAIIDGKKISIDKTLSLPDNTRALRLLGRSIQAELHHYPVFTNPIFVEQSLY